MNRCFKVLFMLVALAVISSCGKGRVPLGEAAFTYGALLYRHNDASFDELPQGAEYAGDILGELSHEPPTSPDFSLYSYGIPKGTRVYYIESGRYLFICYVELDGRFHEFAYWVPAGRPCLNIGGSIYIMADTTFYSLPSGYVHIGNVVESVSHMPTEPFQAANVPVNSPIFLSEADDNILIYSEHFSWYLLYEREP